MIHQAKRRHAGGFVLLEVLVSLAILGLAISTTLRSFTSSLKAAKISKNYTLATMLARAQMEKWEIVSPPEKSLSGTFDPDYPEFSYVAKFIREPLKYDEAIAKKTVPTMVGLTRVSLSIYYASRSSRQPRKQRVLHIESALTKAEKFSSSARLFNEIEFED